MNLTVPLLLVLALPVPQDDDLVSQEELERMTAEIQAEVAALRKQEFPRPVSVAVANEKEFLEYVMKRMERDSTPEQIAAEETIAKLLGLIPAEMDYLEATLELLKGQVGGFYDPDTEGFYLMDRFGGDLAKIILSHELTHALDDQLYDIDGTLEPLQDNADAQLAYHAVVEGSGTGVMNIWTIRNMSKLDIGALMAAGEMGADQLEKAPPYLWKPMIGVYLKGAAFLNRTSNLMAGQMKLPALEDFETAFTEPPLSSEQILHPDKYWKADERDDPIPVRFEAVGALPDGWERITEDTLGELMLGLLVEPVDERSGMKGQLAIVGTKFTYAASEGWGGDRYVLLGKGDARILLLETVWDTAGDADEFAEALRGLTPHIEGVAGATATARGLTGVGSEVVRSESEPAVGFHVWLGVDEELVAAVRSALRVEVAWK